MVGVREDEVVERRQLAYLPPIGQRPVELADQFDPAVVRELVAAVEHPVEDAEPGDVTDAAFALEACDTSFGVAPLVVQSGDRLVDQGVYPPETSDAEGYP